MNVQKSFLYKTKGFLKDIARSEIIFQAVLVGLIAGVLVVLFKLSITWLFEFIQHHMSQFSTSQRFLIFPSITTIGGLVSGILVFKIAPETRGSGIPYVKLTLVRIGKGTRLRSILVKFFAGVAGIGTGLSLGREGPSVQLGAGAGALVAKISKMRGTNQDKLVAAGAGSAIAATFNAPIAGALFVLEELVQKFSSSLLFPVLIATVTAAGIARWFLGSSPSFVIPHLNSEFYISHLPVYIVLGVAAGFLGVAFAKVIYLNIRLYDKIKTLPQWAKPALAGLVVGILGLFIPYILGSGNVSVDMLLAHKFTLGAILIIFIAKFFITPFCFGSGAAGGIFLPTLMIGSFLGYIVGMLSVRFGIQVDPVAIALVGMGAFLASVARTPITAAVMVFEMTGDYQHILPIMLCAAIADLIAEKLNHAPIYTTLIFKQGTKTEEEKQLSHIEVKTAMTKNVENLSQKMTADEAFSLIKDTCHDAFPVVTNKGRLAGLISRTDIEDSIMQGTPKDIHIEKIMNPSPVTIKPEDDLFLASFLLHLNDTNSLIVTDRNKCVKGILTRFDINKVKK